MRDGIDGLRNEDIAEAAGVSPRTFSNYFANKYEALSFRHAMRMEYAAAALLLRPAGEPLWQAVRAALSAPWVDSGQGLDAPSPALLAELRLLFGSRSLQGEILKHATDPQNAFARAIAERLRLPAGDAFYARLLAAAATIVTQVAIDTFLQADPPMPQLPLVLDALDLLATGFPVPRAAVGEGPAGGPEDETPQRAVAGRSDH